MDCAEAKLRIEPYVAGELPADQKEPLEAHLAGCAECRLDSELTRASRNPPTGNAVAIGEAGADAAPADFVETIHPKGPDEAQADASGESWTLSSIFGSGGAGGSGGSGASGGADGPGASEGSGASSSTGESPTPPPAFAPSAPPLPPLSSTSPSAFTSSNPPVTPDPFPEQDATQELPLPEVLSKPVPITRDEPPASDAPTWDFEPADAQSEVKPPEKSLFFAEVALNRSSDSAAKRKSAVSRLVFWGAGGLFGLALLGASIWIAMNVQKPLPPAMPVRPMKAGAGPELPAQSPADPAPTGAPEGAPVPDATGAAGSAPEQAGSSPGTPTDVATQAPPIVPAPQTAPAGPVVGKAPVPAPPAPRSTSTARSVAPPVEYEDYEYDEPEFPQRPPVPKPKPKLPAGTTTTTAPPPAAPPAAKEPAPSAATAPKDAPAAAPAADAVQRPIDRLHLATLTAEQNADLAALRKLRDAWRGFVKSSVGPDRARAKRELADCLWAVQTLTGKAADQKEALAAYRDFVLHAPAGGADRRTVTRMRQLEDAVAETR